MSTLYHIYVPLRLSFHNYHHVIGQEQMSLVSWGMEPKQIENFLKKWSYCKMSVWYLCPVEHIVLLLLQNHVKTMELYPLEGFGFGDKIRSTLNHVHGISLQWNCKWGLLFLHHEFLQTTMSCISAMLMVDMKQKGQIRYLINSVFKHYIWYVRNPFSFNHFRDLTILEYSGERFLRIW